MYMTRIESSIKVDPIQLVSMTLSLHVIVKEHPYRMLHGSLAVRLSHQIQHLPSLEISTSSD